MGTLNTDFLTDRDFLSNRLSLCFFFRFWWRQRTASTWAQTIASPTTALSMEQWIIRMLLNLRFHVVGTQVSEVETIMIPRPRCLVQLKWDFLDIRSRALSETFAPLLTAGATVVTITTTRDLNSIA